MFKHNVALLTKVTQQNHEIKNQNVTNFEGELVFYFCKSPS